jgi:hypothetical protein
MLSSIITRRLTVVAGVALALGACKDPTTVPDLNNLPTTVIENGLSQNTAQLLVTGLANRDRDLAGFRYVVFAGTLGRDVYNIDPSEPRFQTELLGNAIDPAGFIGGDLFTQAYSSVRTADVLIKGISSASDLSAAQQQGVLGIAYTMKALALYREIELRGANGIPLENREPGSAGTALAPIRCAPAALAAISATLDSGATALAAAGTAFAVTLPAGFSGNGAFNTPAGFLRFNRGLKGRTELYRGLNGGGATAYQSAITALNASFLDTTAALTNGVYFNYAAAPDVFNPIAVGTIFLNPSLTTAAAGSPAFAASQVLQTGDRRAEKITVRPTATTRNGVTTNLVSPLASTASSNLTRPLPVLRNAELILLRAQAEIELSQFTQATADINAVRTGEGGLAAIPTITSRTEGIQRVLYEKRFSLLLETGGQRLADLRAYGLLNAANLGASPRGTADAFLAALPIPQAELDQRGQTAAQATCTP